MVTCKKCFQSEDEIERMLEECESEGASFFQKVKTVLKVKVKMKTIQKFFKSWTTTHCGMK